MRNNEGYYDPTAGRAMSSAMKDYKKNQKEKFKTSLIEFKKQIRKVKKVLV